MLGTADSQLGAGEPARAVRKWQQVPKHRCDILCAQCETIGVARAGLARENKESSRRT